MNKIMGVLVRKDAKSEWQPAIYEIRGKTYYTFGVLTDNKPSKGLMDGIYTLKFIKEKKGSTTFTVIDVPKCEFTARPADFFADETVKTLCGDITNGMTEYRAGQQHSKAAGTPTTEAPQGGQDDGQNDDTNW